MKEAKDFQIRNLEIKEYKNKYRLTAEQIYAALGTNNYSNPYNCMTRFRANITDKNLVNVEALKKIPLVKGINWNGPELQIIIGGEVVKVIDEFKAYEIDVLKPKKTDNLIVVKPTIGKRIMAAIVGIMQPAISLVIAAGMLMAIYSLLTLPNGNNLLETQAKNPFWSEGMDPTIVPEFIGIDMGTLWLFDMWSALFFVLSKVILSSIGIFFIYNTARYFNGNKWFAIAVGLLLMARGFFPTMMPNEQGITIGVPFAEAKIGDWTSNMGKSGFLLFKLGEYPMVIAGYEGSIIPFIVGGILVVYLDKWIKSWMPTTIDITFRAMLVILFTMFGLWFILGPISGLIEYGLFFAMNWFGKIPYGFGTAIFAMLWQPLVIIGCHTPLGMALDVSIAQGTPELLGTANVTPYWGQLGAVIAVGLISKNQNLKRASFGTIPAGIFGITEPIIYGINLPRLTPFLFGCAGAGFGGFFIGILNIDMDIPGTFGILSILRFTGNDQFSQGAEIGLLVMIWAITFVTGFLLTFFFYKERKDELSYFKKSIHKLIKFSQNDKTLVNKEFGTAIKEVKDLKKDYQAMNNYYSAVSKLETQMITLENKESKQREKMYHELLKLKTKLGKKSDEQLMLKFKTLNEKYSTFSLDQEKEKVEKEMKQLHQENDALIKKVSQAKSDIYQHSTMLVKNYQAQLTETQTMMIENMIWNALDSVEIGFGINDPKPIKFQNKVK